MNISVPKFTEFFSCTQISSLDPTNDTGILRVCNFPKKIATRTLPRCASCDNKLKIRNCSYNEAKFYEFHEIITISTSITDRFRNLLLASSRCP